VLLFSGCLLGLSALAFDALNQASFQSRYGGWQAWVLTTLAFAISQLSIVRLGQRSDAEDVEFSALVLLIAAFVVPFHTLMVGAVLGTLLVNVVTMRGVLKTIYNIAHRSFIVSLVACIAFRTVDIRSTFEMQNAVVLFIASVVIFGLLEPLMVSIVVYFFRGSIVRVINSTTLAIASLHTAVGLLAASVWVNVHHGSGFALLAVCVYAAGVYAFSRVEQRASRAEALQEFVREIDTMLEREQLLLRSLPFISSAMRARSAYLVVLAREGESGSMVSQHHDHVLIEEMRIRQQEVWPQGEPGSFLVVKRGGSSKSREWLEKFDAHDAIIVPMYDSETVIGAVVVADRPANDRSFDQRDIGVVEAFASHLGVALERQRLLDRLHHSAMHDALTGLPNRALFHLRLERLVFLARSGSEAFAVVMLDLDGFKAVNDSHGHHIGDELLRRVASVFRDSVRPEDTVARLGGDEFAVVLPNANVADATEVADRLVRALDVVMMIEGLEISIGSSFGITTWQESDHTGDDVMRRADGLMYEQKRLRQAG
jgi:diguanylate cyclase (GGDEF)-like protein